MSLSVASTVPATVWFSAASNVAEELNDGGLLVRGGAASSSSRVSVRVAGAVTPAADTVPETVTVLSAASTSLSTPVIVTVPVLVVAFSAKLRTLVRAQLGSRRPPPATPPPPPPSP